MDSIFGVDEEQFASFGPDAIAELHHRIDTFKLIFDSIRHGMSVTDPDGYILYLNKPYGEFLGVDHKEQVGRHCTDVIENSRMHVVAKTGKSELFQPHRIMGHDMVVQRIPIKKDGKVLAVFGQVIFKDVLELHRLADRLSLLESKVKLYEEELLSLRSAHYTFDSIFTMSPVMIRLKEEALKAAGNQLPVLITGESGTGKGVFAQAIHQASRRRAHPLVRINCAAIPRDLLESELFGYEKGAFTGAQAGGKPGKFELAHKGTVFLDEIGDLPLEMQPKLLRVIEEKEIERVGGTTVRRSDFRIIAATNQNLEEMMRAGRFRKDLFYRLNVISLALPPLRERRQEIGPLARHLLAASVERSGFPGMGLDPLAEEALRRHDWPGNVRELINVLERVLSSLDGDTITQADLPSNFSAAPTQDAEVSPASLKKVKSMVEKDAILAALASAENNMSRAAQLLGIHRTLLYKKLKKHGLSAH